MDLNKLHNFLAEVVSKKQAESMDLEERMNLIESRTSAYCNLIKTVQVFNNIISTNPPNIQQYKKNLTIQLEPTYTKIRKIDTQFSKENTNREHYKFPSFVKPQTEKEMDK